MSGGDGIDLIDGGRGNDRLSGGGADGDADVFHFGANWGRDVITDFENGVDRIAIDGVTEIGQLTITTRGTTTTIKVTGDNANTITVLGASAGTVTADDFDFGMAP
jgi:Ca2+-binding RTX toxin-like protein